MRVRLIPGITAIAALTAGTAVVLISLVASFSTAVTLAIVFALAFGSVALFDYVTTIKQWRASAPQLERKLPPAFALGATRIVHLTISHEGTREWRCKLYDHADATLGDD